MSEINRQNAAFTDAELAVALEDYYAGVISTFPETAALHVAYSKRHLRRMQALIGQG